MTGCIVFVILFTFTIHVSCHHLQWNTVQEFVLNSIAFWNLKTPVVILCDDFNGYAAKDMQVKLSNMYVSSLVLPEFREDYVIKLYEAKVLPSDIIMIGNAKSINSGISEVLQLNILKYKVTSIFLCVDCQNLIFNYYEGPDILGQLILAHFKDANVVALNGMHYCYYNHYLIVHEIGVWNVYNGFQVDSSFSVVDMHLNDATLKIISGEVMPYIFSINRETSDEPPPGFCGDVLGILSEMFKFRMNVTESRYKFSYGIYKDGIFTGKYDLGVGIFSRTPSRELFVEFTSPVSVGQNVVAVHFPSKNSARSWSFKPVSLWISISLVIFLTSLSYVLIVYREVEHDPTIDLVSIIMSTWFLQGGVGSPKYFSSRIIYFTSCLLFWILICFFNGTLVSYLTLDSPKVFTTLRELVHSDYTFGVTRDSSSMEWLQMSKDSMLMALKTRATPAPSAYIATEIVCNQKKYAHLSGFAIFYHLFSRYNGTCQYYFIKEIVNDDPYHFITQKNDVLSKRLSKGITRLRSSGLLVRLEKKYNLITKESGKSSAIWKDEYKSSVCQFIADIISEFNMTFPKIFVSNYGVAKQLLLNMSDKNVPAVVKISYNLKVLYKIILRDQAQMQMVFIVENSEDVTEVLITLAKLNLLQRDGLFVIGCFNCDGYQIDRNIVGLHSSQYSNVMVATSHQQQSLSTVDLHLIVYSYENRRIQCQPFGWWDISYGFNTSQLPPFGSDIQNASIHVFSNQVPYYLNYRIDRDKGAVPTGFIGDIIILLSQMFHFSINLTVTGTELYEELLPNNKTVGFISEFLENKLDVAIGLFSRTPRRDPVLGFPFPFGDERLLFVARVPSSRGQDSGRLVKKLFKGYFYIAVLGMVAVVFICSLITSKFGKYDRINDPGAITIAVSLNQGLTELPLNTSSRFIVAISSLFFWAVICYCSTYLISILTVNQPQLISSLVELVNSKYTWGVHKGTSAIDVIKTSQNPVMRTIGSRSKVKIKAMAYEAVCEDDQYAHLFSTYLIQAIIKNQQLCDIYFIKEDLYRDPLHFLTKKDDRYLQVMLSIGIIKLKEYGLMARLKSIYGQNGLMQTESWRSTIEATEGLGLDQINEQVLRQVSNLTNGIICGM
ncbi:hypothetical protein CHUAL_001909 [Chamberlinius hualienensis]